MNICILKESLNIGGTERSTANISKALEEDHTMYVALYDGTKIKYSYGGQLIDLHYPPRSSLIGKIYNTFLRDIKLRQLIKNNHIELLFTFTSIGNRQTRYKYNTIKIISARDFGAMHKKHNEYRQALSNSDAMVCNSKYLRDFYIAKYPQHKDRVFMVYNIIDTDEIISQSKEQVEPEFDKFLSQHKKTVVSVGRFCKEKGFEYLIQAFNMARQNDDSLGLVLVGDGDYLNKYQNIIDENNLNDHIYMTGFQQNPYKYMAKCTCFVLSSLSEGFPNVLAEAMALSLPVIATNCLSGPAEILRNDGDYNAVTDKFMECDYGIITPRMEEENNDNAIKQLSEAINVLLRDKEKIKEYSSLSKQKVVDFSTEAARKQLNVIFNELVHRRKK